MVFTEFGFSYPRPVTDSIDRCIAEGIAGTGVDVSGARVALAVGSRGISCMRNLVASVVSTLKSHGAIPFIIPAMGSHGGATAEGQRAVLAGYGITEEQVGAPVRSSMDTVELPRGNLEHRLFVDRIAWTEADLVVPINRVKSHTDFEGRHESGLLKMLVIGLGKHDQAREMHSFGVRGLRDLVVPAARRVLETGRIPFGIAVVENAYEEPAVVEVVPASEIERRDGELLLEAKRLAARLPVDDIDLLIVDELGKDKSGTGLDTNVIGRRYLPGEEEPATPRIAMIYVRRLSEATHGNALGMGLADIVGRRLADGVDYGATYENIITSSFLERGKLPIVAESDRQAVEIALRALHLDSPGKARALHIANTLELERIGVSAALEEEVSAVEGASKVRTYRFPTHDG